MWERLRTSYWFLPSALASAAVVLSFVLIRIDAWLDAETVWNSGWFYTFGPDGARAILSAVASSMITVAGLTFSITMLTLQLASSQFGPRLLRNFMRDRGNQLVLGTFTATFVYCLVVLRTVRGTEASHFVPHIAVAFGVLLAVASVAVLIYFIHHIATSIRIETLLAELAAETRAAIDRLYPQRMGDEVSRCESDSPDHLIPSDFESEGRLVRAPRSGYVQRVEADALMRVSTAQDLIVRIEGRPGTFVTEGDAVLVAYPGRRVSDEIYGQLAGVFALGKERTPEQDIEFSIRRMVEIAQRALSPGINDPTTALYCIDRLGEVLCRLADREIPAPMRFDEDGHLRVLTEVYSLDALARPALSAIAAYGIADADVVARLLGITSTLARVAPQVVARGAMELSEAIQRESRSQVWFRLRAKSPQGHVTSRSN